MADRQYWVNGTLINESGTRQYWVNGTLINETVSVEAAGNVAIPLAMYYYRQLRTNAVH